MKHFQKILEKIGLSERESIIYLDLLEHPFSLMTDISRRTRIHRPVLYVILPLLKERGVIFSRKQDKRLLYHASNPSVLHDLAQEVESKLISVMPELQSIFESKGNHTSIINYDGITGIQKIYQEVVDCLPYDGEYFAYTGKNIKSDPKFFTKKFWLTRDKKRLKRFVIAPAERAALFRNDDNRKVAYFKKKVSDIFEKNIVKIIFSNKIAVIDFSEVTGFIIESPMLSALEKQHFRMLFEFLDQ